MLITLAPSQYGVSRPVQLYQVLNGRQQRIDDVGFWPTPVISDIEICTNSMTAILRKADIQKPELCGNRGVVGGTGRRLTASRIDPPHPLFIRCFVTIPCGESQNSMVSESSARVATLTLSYSPNQRARISA